SLDSPGLTVYAAVAQSPGAAGEFVVRTSRADAIVISTIRDRLKTVSVDSVVKIESMDDVVGSIEAPWRANLALFGAFAVFTVAVSCLGLYALLAYVVVGHRREIGVRLVLGAPPTRVAIEVVGLGARLVFAGLVLGWLAAAALTPLMTSLLFEVRPSDPVALTVAPLAFVLAALVPCAVPAIRAARTEPAICLRAE